MAAQSQISLLLQRLEDLHANPSIIDPVTSDDTGDTDPRGVLTHEDILQEDGDRASPDEGKPLKCPIKGCSWAFGRFTELRRHFARRTTLCAPQVSYSANRPCRLQV